MGIYWVDSESVDELAKRLGMTTENIAWKINVRNPSNIT